jgi:hypothetical protein
MRSILWWLKVKGDEYRIPNKSGHTAIEKKDVEYFHPNHRNHI